MLNHPAVARVRELLGKILRSRWTWLGSALFFSFLALFLYLETSRLLEIAKAKVRQKAEAGLVGRQVRLGPFTTNFVNTLSVSAVEVSNQGGFGNGTFLKIDQVRVRIRLKDLFRLFRRRRQLARNPASWSSRDTFAFVEVIHPSVSLSRKGGRWDFPRTQRRGEERTLPSLRVQVKDGEARISDDSGKWDGLAVSHVSGWLEKNGDTVRLEASAEAPDGARIRIQAAPKEAGNLQVVLQGSRLPAGDLLRRFAVLPSSVSLSGACDLDVSAAVPWPAAAPQIGTGQAHLTVRQATLTLPRMVADFSADATVRWDPKELEIDSAVLKTTGSELRISGRMTPLLRDRRVDARLSGDLDLAEWAELLPRRLRPAGRASLELTCSGDPKSPTLSGSVRIATATLDGLPLSADAAVQYEAGAVAFRPFAVSWGGATLNLDGSFSRKTQDWSLQVDGASLDSLFPAFAGRLSGRISGSFRGTGPAGAPRLSGKLALRDLNWGGIRRSRLYGRLITRGRTYRTTLVSPHSADRMALELENGDENWDLRRFELRLSDGQRLRISGRMDRGTGRLRGTVAATAVAPQSVEPIVGFLSHFDGRCSLFGRIGGTGSEPELSARLFAKNLLFRNRAPDTAPVGNLSARMLWDRSGVSLTNLKVGNAYRVSFRYERGPQRGFRVEGRVKDGDPKVLFAVLNLETAPSGRLNGSFALSRLLPTESGLPASPWSGEGQLEISDGNWAAIPFHAVQLQYRARKSKIELLNFSILQDDGALIAQAEAEQTKERNPLSLSVSIKNFAVGENRMNGDASLSGALVLSQEESIDGSFKSDRFDFNGFDAGGGPLRGRLELKDKVLALRDLQWSDFFRGDGRLLFGPQTKIEGKWFSSTKDIQEWSRLFRARGLPVAGRMSLSGTVSGAAANPEFRLAADCADLNLANRKPAAGQELPGFSGRGTALVYNHLLKSLSLKLSDPNGGRLTVLGQANLQSHELSLETSFNDLEAQSLFEGLGWKSLKGKSSGTLSLRGQWDNPVAQGEVRGKDGMIGEIPLDAWDISGKFAEKEVLFTRMDLYGRKGSWKFSLLEDSWIRPMEGRRTGSFRLAMDFKNILVGPVTLVGNGVAEGSWSPDEKTKQVAVDGRVQVKQCFVNTYELQPTTVRVRYENRAVQFLGLSQPGDKAGTGDLGITGSADFSLLPCVVFKKFRIVDGPVTRFFLDGHLCPDEPNFRMEGNGVDAALLCGVLESPLTLTGPAVFNMQGSVQDGRPQFEGDLALKNGQIEQIPLDSLDTRFSWKEGLLTVSPLRAKSRDYFTVNASGSFPLALGKHHALSPKVDCTIRCTDGNLSFLNFLDSDWVRDAAGSVSGVISVRGSPGNAKVDGAVTVGKGQFRTRYLARKVEDLSLKLRVKSNRISVQEAEASVGAGRVRASGSLRCDLGTDGLVFGDYRLAVESGEKKGISIQVPELPLARKLGVSAPSKGSPTFALKVTGRDSRPTVSGWVKLEDTYFSWPPKRGEGGSGDWSDWDIELRTGKRTYFQNDMVNAHIQGAIRLKTVQDRLIATGRVVSDEGTISIYGSNFAIRDATLDLQQPSGFGLATSTAASGFGQSEAYLQFRADETRQTSDGLTDTVTLQLERTPLTENFDSKKLTFRSSLNPTLASDKVASQAGLGLNLDGLDPQQKDTQLREGVARLIDSELATPLARVIASRTGLANRIEFTKSSDTGRTAEVRGNETSVVDPLIGYSFLIEKSFGSRLGIGYKATIDKIQDRPDLLHQIQIQYMLFKGFWLYGSRDLDSEKNIGRPPESQGGVRTTIRFDPWDWFHKPPPPPPAKKKTPEKP